MRPSFSKAQLQDLNTFEVHIKQLLKQLPHDGSTVDLQPLFFRLTLDSSTEFLFGESTSSLLTSLGSEQQIFASALDYAQSQLISRGTPGKWVSSSENKRFLKACKTVHDFADKYVYQALAHCASERAKEKPQEKPLGRYVFLNELAKETDDPQRLRNELMNLLIGGRDTTASLLSNTFHVLARRPDIWSRLKTEVDELAGETPDYETLRNMKYVKNLLNECKPTQSPNPPSILNPPSSPASLPRRPHQHTLRHQIHYTPPRRRPRGHLPHLHSGRARCPMVRLCHAPPPRHLW